VSGDAIWLQGPAVESSGIEAGLLAHYALQSLVAAMDMHGMDLGSWVLVRLFVSDSILVFCRFARLVRVLDLLFALAWGWGE